MANELTTIIGVLKDCLGEPKDENSYETWSHWNCPNCDGIEGGLSSNKFNLEINILDNGGWCHCWKCGYAGKLTRLIREFGGDDMLHRFITEINTLRASKYYILDDHDNNPVTIALEDAISLPIGFKPLNKNDFYAKNAYDYLYGRGITDDIIEYFNIGYVGYNKNAKPSMRNRIIIPSYDANGELNYWVSRDYTGTAYLKHNNPKYEKKLFIFNEGLVNWDEDITLVEGVFDHIVTPNSIPLLGKSLDATFVLYHKLLQQAHANVNILLDDDAITTARKLYKSLYNTLLRDRLRIIECPQGYDASLIYQTFGKNGIIKLLRTASQISEYTLQFI